MYASASLHLSNLYLDNGPLFAIDYLKFDALAACSTFFSAGPPIRITRDGPGIWRNVSRELETSYALLQMSNVCLHGRIV